MRAESVVILRNEGSCPFVCRTLRWR